MLTKEDNELVAKVGPGTPMGELMRQYWVPALLSRELPGPDSDPVRVRLLGEDLIGFRTTSGEVGLIANLCPHRGASLFYGRNEEDGLRCVYHGWKFGTDGSCVDMPNEPSESNFKNRIKAVTYPTAERGGIVWAYLGSRETPPPLPDIEANGSAGGDWDANAVQRGCNWLQALEGDIDTSHQGFLHHGHERPEDLPDSDAYRQKIATKNPKFTALETEGGAMYGAFRPAGAGENYWRIAQFLFPFFTQPPTDFLVAGTRAWVPMDDDHTMFFRMVPSETRAADASRLNIEDENTTDWYGRFRLRQTEANDYEIDRDRQRTMASFTGINTSFAQDQAVTESMGTVLDRTNEHLGTSDLMIIRVRRRLIEAAKALAEQGIVPPGVDDPTVYRVRSGPVILPESADWVAATEDLRAAYGTVPDQDPELRITAASR